MKVYYTDEHLEDRNDYEFQTDLPERDPLEIRRKEYDIVKQRFIPTLYDPTPVDVAFYDCGEEMLEKIKNDNQR